MSRSKKKTPVIGNCSSSGMKSFRTSENKAERRLVNNRLKQGMEEMPHRKEYQNEWSSPRDGKHYFSKPKTEYRYSSILRAYTFNWIQYWIKFMRKK